MKSSNKFTPTDKIITAVANAVPELKYCAKYNATDTDFNSCTRAYQHRSFIYLLTVDWHGAATPIYAGRTCGSYSRMLMHKKNFEFDHIYLFECKKSRLSCCEENVIKTLAPLYNRDYNPSGFRFGQLLNIEYDGEKSKVQTLEYLDLFQQCKNKGVFTFELHEHEYLTLKLLAQASDITPSQYLGNLITHNANKQIINAAISLSNGTNRFNALTTAEYASLHNISQETAKKYVQQGKLPSAKVGGVHIIPPDSAQNLPPDRRKKQSDLFSDGFL